jgi:hypothetical protein
MFNNSASPQAGQTQRCSRLRQEMAWQFYPFLQIEFICNVAAAAQQRTHR